MVGFCIDDMGGWGVAAVDDAVAGVGDAIPGGNFWEGGVGD